MEEQRTQVSFANMSVADFVEQLCSAEPVPGGGAASAVAASLGAALVSMVASLSMGRPKYAQYVETHEDAVEEGQQLADELLAIADKDASAYAGYSRALKMPRQTEAQIETRREAIRAAARLAADVPWECVQACRRVVEAAESLAGRSNVNAASDVLVAAMLAETGARGAAENVLINLPSVGDEEYSRIMSEQLDAALHDISTLALQTREIVLSGREREPEVL
jgi:formiminotetrahydrofolate cyclodeaminase